MKNILFFSILSLLALSSCTDVIEVDLDEGQSVLVVDAFLTNMPGEQVIKLRYTDPYFSNEFSPTATGATVVVSDNQGNDFTFTDEDNDGNYTWFLGNMIAFGNIGRDYTLTITLEGKTYVASSSMNPVPPIDSISTEFRESELGQPEGHYAELHAVDLPGKGNCYWIKTFKNGVFLNKPQEFNLAFDGSFTEGANADGVAFIQPIAEGINRVPDSGDGAVDTDDLPPYVVGDSIRVELHSITIPTFYFFDEVRTQTTLGDAGIFAEPPTNVPTNIVATDSEEKPQGFFSVASVSVAEKVVE